MTGKTHLSAGVIVGVVLSASTNSVIDTSAAIIAASSFGSLFPDIDMTQSKLGHMIWPISFPINKIFGHRGFIHSPILYLLISVCWQILFPQYKFIMWGFLIGAISHLALDSLNPKGVPILYPMKKKFNFANIETGTIWETLFFLATFSFVGYKYHYVILNTLLEYLMNDLLGKLM